MSVHEERSRRARRRDRRNRVLGCVALFCGWTAAGLCVGLIGVKAAPGTAPWWGPLAAGAAVGVSLGIVDALNQRRRDR